MCATSGHCISGGIGFFEGRWVLGSCTQHDAFPGSGKTPYRVGGAAGLSEAVIEAEGRPFAALGQARRKRVTSPKRAPEPIKAKAPVTRTMERASGTMESGPLLMAEVWRRREWGVNAFLSGFPQKSVQPLARSNDLGYRMPNTAPPSVLSIRRGSLYRPIWVVSKVPEQQRNPPRSRLRCIHCPFGL